MPDRVLVADDEAEIRTAFSRALRQDGFEVELAEDGAQALELIEHGAIDLVLLDVAMPRMSGLDVLAELRARKLAVPVVVVSGEANIGIAVQAVKLGAFDFVQKPLQRERLVLTVRNALRYEHLQAAHERLKAEVPGSQLVGRSAAMLRLDALIAKVAPSDGRVLITGENGTGKELVAAAIHAGSRRATAPFVKLNCGAVPKDLIESELFGHEKGAFTGAVSMRKGRFELAHGGTLLLDEIGDMPMPMQVKLLRVLQEGQLERVGATRSLAVDVRVLTATHRDLATMVREGAFREDLYYRLAVVSVEVPPLRARRDDIPLLLEHFTRPGCSAHGITFSPEAVRALQLHDFPGNVRELSNLVERLAILHRGERIDELNAREALAMTKRPGRAERSPVYEPGRSLRDMLHEHERQVIAEAVAHHGNNKSAAAEALGAERSHFYKKCRALGIGDDSE